jgi:hypothetical protein
MSRHARHVSHARRGRPARGGRHARSTLPALLPLLAVLFARLVVAPGALALDPAPALSKHWRAGAATVRLAVVALLVMALFAALRTSVILPLARWIWY